MPKFEVTTTISGSWLQRYLIEAENEDQAAKIALDIGTVNEPEDYVDLGGEFAEDVEASTEILNVEPHDV